MGAGAGAAENDGISAAGAWAAGRGGELARIWGVTWLSRASSAAGLAQAAPPVTRLNRLGIRRWGCGAAGACADKVGAAMAGAGCAALAGCAACAARAMGCDQLRLQSVSGDCWDAESWNIGLIRRQTHK